MLPAALLLQTRKNIKYLLVWRLGDLPIDLDEEGHEFVAREAFCKPGIKRGGGN